MIKICRDYKYVKKFINSATVVIGNFDGIHFGHKKVIKKSKEIAKESKNSLVILTFFPHPLKVLRPGSEPESILSLRTKIEMLDLMGVDIILAQNFTKAFSKISARKFVLDILLDALSTKNIVIGNDFRFGHNREGDIKYLNSKDYIKKFKVHVIGEEKGKYGRYSSTSIREMIKSGDMLKVKENLGYFYVIEGRVTKGAQLGRKLGFPTANINYRGNVIPKDGVYAAWVYYDKKYYMAAVSTGVRPHFKGKNRFLEAYLLDFSGDLYGKRIKVSLVEQIREEMVFSDVKDLKKEMSKDCDKAVNILNKNKI